MNNLVTLPDSVLWCMCVDDLVTLLGNVLWCACG